MTCRANAADPALPVRWRCPLEGERRSRYGGDRGFTLIELLIVVAIVALASAVASLSLRDPSSTQLEREATRLAALLESARAEARATGLQVLWVPGRGEQHGFRFVGLPAQSMPPQQWLGDGVEAEVLGARFAVLGPEPVIGAQRILLRLNDQRLMLVTDGLGPFTISPAEAAQ